MAEIVRGERNDFIETKCVFTFEGRDFEAGGSWIMVNKETGLREGVLYHYEEKGYNNDGVHVTTNHFVGTWDGSIKVHAVRLNSWRSNFGDERSHYYFKWDGIKFYGIQAGDNEIVRCREYKYQ